MTGGGGWERGVGHTSNVLSGRGLQREREGGREGERGRETTIHYMLTNCAQSQCCTSSH